MREGKLKWNRRMKPTFQTQHTANKFLPWATAVGLISLQLDTRRQEAFPRTERKRREPEVLVDVPNPRRSSKAIVPSMRRSPQQFVSALSSTLDHLEGIGLRAES